MAKSLVIVESPAKVKTINKILGPKFKVTSSMGHCIDLPKSALGVDVDSDFAPKFIVVRAKQKTLSKLKKEEARAREQVVVSVQNLKAEVAALQTNLEKLLDVYLDETISKQEYTDRKQKLLLQKKELEEKITDFERKGVSWVEPAREFILSLNQANQIVEQNQIEEMTPFLKKSGSNHTVHNRRLVFSWSAPYNLVAALGGPTPKNLTYSNSRRG